MKIKKKKIKSYIAYLLTDDNIEREREMNNIKLIVCLAKIIFTNLFYYSTYFTIQLIFATTHESHCTLILFMGLTVLFQLTFIFIYSTFSKKFSILAK